MREAAVLGGTGFIGRGLVRALLDSGQAVRVVSRSARPGRHNEPGLTYVPGDVGNADDMRRAVAGASVVYHLATGGGESWSDFERDFLQGLRNIAGACLDNGVERLVYTSSIAGLYLGGGGSIDERTGPDPSPQQRRNYARARIQAEKIVHELAARRNLPAAILRPRLLVRKGRLL